MRQVSAAVIVESGRLLLARRSGDDPLAGLWELPGGKLEEGETILECIERELAEELEMRSAAIRTIATTTYRYDHGEFQMIAVAVRRLGDFKLTVHDAFAWVAPEELDSYALAPADVQLLDVIGFHSSA